MKVLLAATLVVCAAAQSTPAAWNSQAAQLYQQGRYGEAAALYRRLLDATSGARDRAVIEGNLGTVLRAAGRYREAAPMLVESLRALEAAAGPGSTDVAEALVHLAALYRATGDLANAEACATRAGKILPEPERAANRLCLAAIYGDQRRFAEATAILEALLEDPPGPLTVIVYSNLASNALAQDRLADAEIYAARAVDTAEAWLPASHPSAAAALNNLAQVYRFTGRYLQAEANYRKAIAIWRDTLGPEHPSLAKGLMNMGAFYHERGRESGAEDLYRQAARIFEQAFGKNHPQTLVARSELADVLRAERRYAEAEQLSRATLPALEKALGADDARVVRARANEARLRKEGSHKPQSFQ